MASPRAVRLFKKGRNQAMRIPRDLAAAIGLSESPCLRRVTRLESAGLITGYGAHLDAVGLGLKVTALVNVTLDRQAKSSVEKFEKAISDIPEVVDLYLITGGYDYMLRLVARDLDDFSRVIREELLAMPWIAHLQSAIVVQHVLHRSTLPLKPARRDRPSTARRATRAEPVRS